MDEAGRDCENQQAMACLLNAVAELRRLKPGDRSELDRHYAVVITEMEKAVAYFYYYVFDAPR